MPNRGMIMGTTYAGNKLNDTNKQVLSFIERFLGQHRYAPSLDEIVEGTTAKSKGHVSPCLDRLENMGYIQLMHMRSLESIQLL